MVARLVRVRTRCTRCVTCTSVPRIVRTSIQYSVPSITNNHSKAGIYSGNLRNDTMMVIIYSFTLICYGAFVQVIKEKILFGNMDLILPNKLHRPLHYKIGITCVYNGHVFYTLL